MRRYIEKSKIKVMLSAISLMIFACLSDARADEEKPNYKSDKLTGDWGGYRSKMYDSGLDVSLVYTVDAMSNLSGGVKRGSDALDNADLIFTIDGEKAYKLKGSTISLYLLNNNGGRPNDKVGSLQGVDNIEVGTRTAKVFEAWVDQKFMDDKFSLRGGLYNLNSEFYVTDSSAIFINSTYGIGTEFAQSGMNGPSIFPTTSMALRAKWEPVKDMYIQAAVLDGVPGDPSNPKGTHIKFKHGDGALYVGECGYKFDVAKISIGGWGYSEKSDDVMDLDANGNPLKRSNHGAYAMVEKDITKKLTAFGRFGVADENVNQSVYAWATGVNVKELIPGRADGVLGFAVSAAHNASKYKRTMIASGSPVHGSETQFELTYSDKLLPWFTVQPDVQYTINPGTDPTLRNAWLVGLRCKIAF